MTTGIDVHDETLANPLDLMELVAGGHGWSYDRATDQDMSLEVVGHWCDYRMFLTWHHEVGALLFACAYDIKVPTHKRNEISALLAMINEKMLVGHFDLWSDDGGLPVFRHAVLLRGSTGASVEQLEDLLDIAMTECERYYPAFQFVIWGGHSPADAMAAAMLETAGEA